MTPIITCAKCHQEGAFINEWEGWQWDCLTCGAHIRKATPKEIKTHEEILATINDKTEGRA